MNEKSLKNIKNGDIVAVVALYEGAYPVKVIRTTKKYIEVSLKNLPKGHSVRYSDNEILEKQLYYIPTGVKKGANNKESLLFCPDYILPLDYTIASLEKELEEIKYDVVLDEYRKERKIQLENLKKAKKEGVQA